MSFGVALVCALGGAPGAIIAQQSFRGEVAAIDGSTAVVLADGRRIRLQGLSLPTPAVRPDGFARQLGDFLRGELVGASVRIDADARDSAGDWVATLHPGEAGDGPSINERALAAGLAVFGCRTPRVASLDRLLEAARRAQSERAGWFARGDRRLPERIPYLNGAVLGLYYKDARADYRRQIDELGRAGFRHVCLLLTAMVADVHAHTIDRRHRRTVTDERLIETIGLARARGMSVMLMPVVLLEEADEADWRGTLRPKDEAAFWLAYDAFLAHYLDVAEATGVSIFSVGSELGSLEDRTETWRRLIQNARGRFSGWLTYSANWDHAHVPRFFGLLDLVGLTGYFSLTDKKDPTFAELVAAWRRVGTELEAVVGKLGKPVIITELGYPSQDGINRDPWNYLMNTSAVDLSEQVDCFRAFLEVVPSLRFLRGAYFFDYFEEGGREDHTYSPRGKPAMEEWRRWAGYRGRGK